MALLIYTSGTTGMPKGIIYEQRHLTHGAHFFGVQCEMSADSVALLKSQYIWAVVEWELFPALTLGGRLVVAAPDGHRNPQYLADTVAAERVSVLMITPQVLELLLDTHEAKGDVQPLGSLLHVAAVGEPLGSALANRASCMRGLHFRLHNFYGASESSCAVYTVPLGGVDLRLFPANVPAGQPQPHTQVYVMHALPEALDQLSPVPTGMVGEVCFGGALAAGYWKRAELTAQQWLETGAYGRLFRTGDLGRWKGGLLEVLGRADRQVKINGVRVQPEEVEAALERFGSDAAGRATLQEGGGRAIAGACVLASGQPAELFAFVGQRGGAAPTAEALRAHCEAQLPRAYVPSTFVVLPELPRLPTGKPDLPDLHRLAARMAAERGGELRPDSMGEMRRMSRAALAERRIARSCYAYWMLGVLLDHFCSCYHFVYHPLAGYVAEGYCTDLASASVPAWVELLVRSVGNDQNLFGFILVETFLDSRPEVLGAPTRVRAGGKDVVLLVLVFTMTNLVPMLSLHLRGTIQPFGHFWYLQVVLWSRMWLFAGQKLGVPGWLQALAHLLLTCWLREFRNWYALLYVVSFRFARTVAAWADRRLPRGAVWAVASAGLSMLIGVWVAALHYPHWVMEWQSDDVTQTVLELGVCLLQPLLFIIGASRSSLDLPGWLGDTSLGCYVLHFYFAPEMRRAIHRICHALRWDRTGLLTLLGILSACLLFMSTAGPAGQLLLVRLRPYVAGPVRGLCGCLAHAWLVAALAVVPSLATLLRLTLLLGIDRDHMRGLLGLLAR